MNRIQEGQQMEPNEMLDKVLFWFSVDLYERRSWDHDVRIYVTLDAINQSLYRYFPELNNADFMLELPLIIKQLERDEFIENDGMHKYQMTECYSINFAGKYFRKDGGYRGRKEREEMAKKSLDASKLLAESLSIRGEQNARYLNTLTLILTIGTVALFFATCLEKFHLMGSIVLWSSLYLFLLGIGAGILVSIAIVLLLKKASSKES